MIYVLTAVGVLVLLAVLLAIFISRRIQKPSNTCTSRDLPDNRFTYTGECMLLLVILQLIRGNPANLGHFAGYLSDVEQVHRIRQEAN